MTPRPKEACFACGGLVPVSQGPTHRYLESSPGCWELFGKVMAKEFSRRAYFEVHPLSVDAYAVQHPGSRSPQTIQSAAIHLIGLHAVFEHDYPLDKAAILKQRAKARLADELGWLEPPDSLGAVTVVDVAAASNAADHAEWVRRWARSAWDAWTPHHETIRGWSGRLW